VGRISSGLDNARHVFVSGGEASTKNAQRKKKGGEAELKKVDLQCDYSGVAQDDMEKKKTSED